MKKVFLFCIALLAMNLTYSQVITDGLIGYWGLDGNANDTAGVNNWNGTIDGATTTEDRFGTADAAYEFAVYSKISIPSVTRTTKSMSISIWCYPTEFSGGIGNWMVNQRGNPTNDQFQIMYNATGTYFSVAYGPTLNDWLILPADAMVLNQWNHLVLVTDGTAGSALNAYVNNVAQTPATLPSDMNYNMTHEIRIGQTGWATAGQLLGKVDEVALFDRSLTAAEVDEIYNYDPNGGGGNDCLWTDNGTNIYRVGKVAVNTETLPAGFDFAVDGKAVAKEVKVTLSGWADFVFEKDYELPTLEEVEKHILKKGHLPDVPSAKKVEEDGGFSLGEVNKILLQKIEELTLYTIQQEKHIKAQEKRLKALEDELAKKE